MNTLVALALMLSGMASEPRPRARDLGIVIGTLPRGPDNAITDVEGVRVGHVTRVEGKDIRTGVTVILPHPGNLFRDKVPAGIVVANGFGKFVGVSQIAELGEIETPIALTNTLSVWRAADALVSWTLAQPGNERVGSVNPVVGETNDGQLNAIRKRVIGEADVLRAIADARGGPVAEGSVGAGTGTVAFGMKGGIGTSSRVLPATDGGYRVGVLVQSNYGGSLRIGGAPAVNRARAQAERPASADGSIIIIVATDAPLSDRSLTRLARRAMAGLARTGAAFSNGSGDYALAFSTAPSVRRTPARRDAVAAISDMPNDRMTPLFVAVADATEEAILNSLFRATTVEGWDTATGKPSRVEAIDPNAAIAPPSARE